MNSVLVIVLLAAIALTVSSWFFLSMGKFTEGALAMPLDDSYIYFQYARNISEGRFFHYSATDRPSTGATSYTYALILGAAYWLGARGDSIILFAFVLGTVLLFASSVLVREILIPLAGQLVSTAAAVLLLLNGHVVWAYLSGMEVGLFGTMILLTLLLFQRERHAGRFIGTSISAAAMGVSRPEGFFLAVPVAALVFLTARDRSRSERLLLAAVCLSGGLQFLLNFSLTGSLASTGAQAKSVFHTQEPDIWRLYMARFFKMPWHVLRLFMSDFYSSSFGPGWARISDLFLSCGFVTAGLGFLLKARNRDCFPLLLASWVVLAVFLSLVPWAWDVHHHRYQVPFFPVFLVIAAAGFELLIHLFPARLRLFPSVPVFLLFLLVGISFHGTARTMALQYSHNCENIYEQQVKVGRWIRQNTASDVTVGLNDAGAIAYVGERDVFDFVGIVTPNQAVRWRTGIGAIVEALERIPAERRPTLLAIYPGWLPFLVESGIAGTEVFRAHLRLNTICGGTDKVVYLPDWSLLRTGEPLPSRFEPGPRTLVDSLDVGDLTSERQHAYRPLGKWRSEAKVLTDSKGNPILDGGRRQWEGEKMRVACVPSSPLLVILRLDDEPVPVTLHAEGILVGTAVPEADDGRWSYVSFTVPRELVRADEIGMTVTVSSDDDDTGCASYHYWFMQ